MQGPHLVYFADPMCSWCWGFSPVMGEISQRFGAALPIRLVLGGLRPWTREAMDQGDRANVRGHWEHVHQASGQPFDFGFFEREHFVYDTEPASRAVVVLRRRGMPTGLAALRRIQRAFYAENRDVTHIDTLAALAVELGVDDAGFREEFASDAAREDTRADFALAQACGIRGFPTLIAGEGGDKPYDLVTHGFQPSQRILAMLDAWSGRTGQPAAPGAGAGESCALH